MADLPTNADVLKILKNSVIGTKQGTPNNAPEIHFSVNDSCVILWYLGAKWKWLLGYTKEKDEGENYLVEHLERVKTSNDMLWKYPATNDVTSVSADCSCRCKGDWLLNQNARQMTFEFQNATGCQNDLLYLLKIMHKILN